MNFFIQTFTFFLQNIPFKILLFIILHFIFRITRKCKYLSFFKKFSVLGQFFVFLLTGNTHYFTFISFVQTQTMFSNYFSHKLYLLLWIIVFFVTIIYIVGGYLIFKYLYRKIFKYFLSQGMNKINSILYFTFYKILR